MSNCLCYCLPLSGNDTCSRFGGTPRRQDVRKTHRMTEVCLTDTYTGVQKLSLFLLCCVSSKPCPIWNNTLQHIHTHTHLLPHANSILTSVFKTQAKRAWRAQAVKLNGKFSWSSEARSVPIPVPWPESQETHTGNGFTQQDPQCFLQKNRK